MAKAYRFSSNVGHGIEKVFSIKVKQNNNDLGYIGICFYNQIQQFKNAAQKALKSFKRHLQQHKINAVKNTFST